MHGSHELSVDGATPGTQKHDGTVGGEALRSEDKVSRSDPAQLGICDVRL